MSRKFWCKQCGNEEVDPNTDCICEKCKAVWAGWPLAAKALEVVHMFDDSCCEGFEWNRSHYYFHGKGWEWSNEDVSVEAGVNFFADCATTYWTFDSDSVVESHVYGDNFPYPAADDSEGWQEWYAKLEEQLTKSADAARDMDVVSCSECGCHYHAGNEPCCVPEEPSVYEQLSEIEEDCNESVPYE